MKKLFLPIVFLSALALSGATVPAVATPVAAPAVVEAVQPVSADSAAVLPVDTVVVTTTPAPAPEPAPAESTPVEPAPAPVESVEPSVAPVAPAAPVESVPAPVESAPVEDSYPAPAPTVECNEDEPCWDCKTMGNGICGNPACKAMNQFTVDTAGTCSNAPIGWTEADVRAEGYKLQAELGRPYLASGSNALMERREGFSYVESETIPSTTHVFG